jgi:AAA family ATP:ADP antiporter
LPTTREEKYKAKQATDTFFVRAGDVFSGVLVLIGTTLFAFRTSQFALFCIGLIIVWFALAVVIGIENKKMTERAVESPMV